MSLSVKGLSLRWKRKNGVIIAKVGPIALKVFSPTVKNEEPMWVWVWEILPALLWDKGKNRATTTTGKRFWNAWMAQRNAEKNFNKIYTKINESMKDRS